MRSHVWGGTAAAVLGALLVAGCGGGDGGGDGTANRAAGGADATGHPVTVTDCQGAGTTFRKPPEKIVTSNAAALELLLRLGVGDKVIGTGFPPGKGTLPDGLDAQARQVKVLSRTVIPKEKLLGSGADLYIDTFAAMKMGGGMGDAPTEKEFQAAGIAHMHLKSTACAARRSSPMTDLSAVEDDITALGKVTGTAPEAEKLVRGMRKKVDAVQKAVGSTPERKRPTYFFFDYDAGTKQPTAVCNRQVAHAVITRAGARNIFADCDGAFKKVGWEDVISRNPDWIQLAVRNRGSAAADEKAFDAARKWLETNSATKGLTAVKKGRFLRIHSERTTIAGVTDADTVEEIAETLYPGKVG
ncbi:ABC transporter substrate-binding protein [Streptomyces qinglanensis]|uniref:ABC transporter substrate-binding protein n=1 Tax=Streptomyces qinglanensis TaxID=943816 RepID=UPI00379ECD54